MKKASCIIIEDEYLARLKITEFVSQLSELQLLGAFATIEEATNSGEIENCDIFLLDINLPDGDGLQFAKDVSKNAKVIFTTAYSEHAVEGFNLNATDYLLKPIAFSRFQLSIEKALDQISIPEDNSNYIFLKQGRSLIKCKLDEVSYIKGMQEYLYWKTAKGKIVTLGSLTEYAKELAPNNFVRIHRSYIVNLDKIEELATKSVSVDKQVLPIGASFAKNFRSSYLEFIRS